MREMGKGKEDTSRMEGSALRRLKRANAEIKKMLTKLKK